MISFKKKMEIMETVNSHAFSNGMISDYLEYAKDPSLKKSLLKRIFSLLVILDTEISAAYDILDDDEWEGLFSNFDSPPSDISEQLKQRVELFTLNFSSVAALLNTCTIQEITEIIEPLFKNRTHDVQFMIFLLDKLDMGKFFGFLASRMRKNPRLYAPFFCSLAVRLALSDDLSRRCFAAYFKYAMNVPLTQSIDAVVAFQFLLYFLCFKKEYYTPDVAAFVKRVYDAGLFRHMNRDVIDMFSNIFAYKCPGVGLLSGHECLYYFPFDWPICKSIQALVADSFVHFAKEDS